MLGIAAVTAVGIPRPARAQFAVIDIAAIAQAIEQIRWLEMQFEQLSDQYDAITGSRGFEQLLRKSLAQRNYLPAEWEELRSLIASVGGAAGSLRGELDAIVAQDAVLDVARLQALGARVQEAVGRGRRATALTATLSREALEAASGRFVELQTLIDAIRRTDDQKSILELQSRISAEQTMLQNEQVKLQALWQTAEAEQRAQAQQLRELAVLQHGVFTRRFAPSLSGVRTP